MGKKKAIGGATGGVAVVDNLKPLCYFCDRSFNDETVLVQHQRSRHFRCTDCDVGAIRGKCESVQGLIVHTLKVHGKTLARVPNALEGRDSPDQNVYGMDGVPEHYLRQKGFPVPGDQPPEPEPEESRRGAGRGGIAPPLGELPPPSIPSSFDGTSAMAGLPALPGCAALPPLPGMPAMPSNSAPQDFLDFLNKAGQPAPSLSHGLMGTPQNFSMPASFVPNGSLPPLPDLPPLPQTLPNAGTIDPFLAPLPALAPLPTIGSQYGVANHSNFGAQFGVGTLGGLPNFEPPPRLDQLAHGGVGIKRPFEEMSNQAEDISVEEKRARFDRYRIPR